MPPRKEAKETVVYPASKRKAPPFKPQRPSKVLRASTAEHESSAGPTRGPSEHPMLATRRPLSSSRIDTTDEHAASSAEEDSDEDLADNPLQARPRPRPSAPPTKRTMQKLPAVRQPSPTPYSSPQTSPDNGGRPDQDEEFPTLAQSLLVRLLHEHFAREATKIDRRAVEVLQKYIDVFVREAIARAALRKREDAAKGNGGVGSPVDTAWMELEDLDKIAAGMMLDFS